MVADRPPKPPLSGRSSEERSKLPEWATTEKREVEKIQEEDMCHKLPRNSRGDYIFPKNMIRMKLIVLHEYKWKVDPITGAQRWFQCTIIVCDGSCDKREGEQTYAECTDRAVLYLMVTLDAIERAYVASADV